MTAMSEDIVLQSRLKRVTIALEENEKIFVVYGMDKNRRRIPSIQKHFFHRRAEAVKQAIHLSKVYETIAVDLTKMYKL